VRRRDFITLASAAASCIARPLSLGAEPVAKTYRVAYLALAGDQDAIIVKQRLEELGYHDGRNLLFDFRSAQGRTGHLAELAAELVRTNPDVIVAGFGTATAKALQAATVSVPIVFTTVGDPIGSGLVKSLNRPGANVTGMHAQAADIIGKRLQVLEDLVPGVRTVAVLVNLDAPITAVVLPELRIAADIRRQRLELCDVTTLGQLPVRVEAAIKAGATGLTIVETPLLLDLRQEIVDLAVKLRLPAIYSNREFVDVGGLASYGADRRQLYRRAAELVDKIVKGQKPADIPVEQPTKFELVINLKAAKTLGITIAPTLLATADEVIE
jgi:putative tryptophan/tyrosine transport system substrate-binding protein